VAAVIGFCDEPVAPRRDARHPEPQLPGVVYPAEGPQPMAAYSAQPHAPVADGYTALATRVPPM
jgi:hypothetical protein